MEYVKLAKTTSAFQQITDSDPTLPIISTCSVNKQNYSNSADRIINKLENEFGYITGTQTQSTDYVAQINTILATYTSITE